VERLTVRIRGRVQGVGFRYATLAMAQGLRIAGWVRNCPDGSVEAAFFGPRTILEQARDWCRHGPPGARVDDLEESWAPADSAPHSFNIR